MKDNKKENFAQMIFKSFFFYKLRNARNIFLMDHEKLEENSYKITRAALFSKREWTSKFKMVHRSMKPMYEGWFNEIASQKKKKIIIVSSRKYDDDSESDTR